MTFRARDKYKAEHEKRGTSNATKKVKGPQGIFLPVGSWLSTARLLRPSATSQKASYLADEAKSGETRSDR